MRFDQFLKEVCPRLDLQWRKYRRRDARRRVERRMAELGLPDYAAYLDYLLAHEDEAGGLAERMRVTVSRFFREYPRWLVLAQTVLPQLIAQASPRPLRLWSAGCCGGEEPYTLAMLWREHFAGDHPERRVEILASDIDGASLARARGALYDAGSLREVPRDLRARYFERVNGRYRLGGEITSLVRFAQHDLLRQAPPQDIDLVCCRYLAFTYYRGERLLTAALRLHQALRPEGALMIARKEDLGAARGLFAPWAGAAGVFQKITTQPSQES